MQQDLVISAISGYEFEKIKHWVHSLGRTGYKGRKAMVVHNVSDYTIKKLQEHGFEIFLTTMHRNKENNGYHFADNFGYQVPHTRHYFNWLFLKDKPDIRYVISTDVDVIFQSDPSEWLEKNLGDKKLNYGCEGLKYKDEAWGNGNMMECFGPVIHEHMKERPIYNAGSMAGEYKTFVDYSLAVWLSIANSKHPTPDQAGVNLMLSLEPYKSITKFNDHDTNWACQCGTTVDPSKIAGFRPNLLSPEPTFDGEFVYNSKGEKYVLVHQYNRVPDWKARIESKYENRI
jgi:hypothetical protein